MSDEYLRCYDCGTSFPFSADLRAVFAADGLPLPKRCGRCRQARHDRIETLCATYVSAFADIDDRRALYRLKQKQMKKGRP